MYEDERTFLIKRMQTHLRDNFNESEMEVDVWADTMLDDPTDEFEDILLLAEMEGEEFYNEFHEAVMKTIGQIRKDYCE